MLLQFLTFSNVKGSGTHMSNVVLIRFFYWKLGYFWVISLKILLNNCNRDPGLYTTLLLLLVWCKHASYHAYQRESLTYVALIANHQTPPYTLIREHVIRPPPPHLYAYWRTRLSVNIYCRCQQHWDAANFV